MKNAQVRITRDSDFFGIIRKLKVYIDKNHVGSVRWNDSVDFPISPGKHQLYVKMDWCKSKPLHIEVSEIDLFEYNVTLLADESIFGVLKQLSDMIFNFSNFFKLKRVDSNRPSKNQAKT